MILKGSDSPTFRELIQSVPNTSHVANGKESDPLPVVELPENGATLYSLGCSHSSTSEKIMELLSVAQKYHQMDAVSTHIRGPRHFSIGSPIHAPRDSIPGLRTRAKV